ncbi:MAG: 30S ribosome-binding factor RbfA [Lachnospiraceae bacterium]|nr:30S ribosome-binding factor RbfA [Lachnospiraceae bacterium]MDY4971531.1 30S ribosome-binding factor RbfA [Lachnospiraceae bacterium]
MRKNSIKNIRINEEVKKELSNIIRNELKDPRIHMMTSVVSVEVAPDLKTCKAYISVLGSEKEANDTLAGLKNASGYIKTKLARSVNLRNTPEIIFRLDQSIEHGIHIAHILDELHAGEKAEAAGEGDEADTDAEEVYEAEEGPDEQEEEE